jgi:hypothetical protein
MYTLPDTTYTTYRKFASGDDDTIEISIPGDSEQYWVIRGIDWSTDQKSNRLGVIEVLDSETGEAWWRHFFEGSGLFFKTFKNAEMVSQLGKSVTVRVTAKRCEKNLSVRYK